MENIDFTYEKNYEKKSEIDFEKIFKKKKKTYLDKILLSLDMNQNIPMTIEQIMINNNDPIHKQCYYYAGIKSGIYKKILYKIINPGVKTKFKGHKYILL